MPDKPITEEEKARILAIIRRWRRINIPTLNRLLVGNGCSGLFILIGVLFVGAEHGVISHIPAILCVVILIFWYLYVCRRHAFALRLSEDEIELLNRDSEFLDKKDCEAAKEIVKEKHMIDKVD